MAWWQYLLLVNLYLVLFYGFYALLLRSETFFQLNRVYLVASAILSFLIPLIHADWVRNLFITQKVQYNLFVYSAPIMVYHFKPIEDRHITLGQLLLFIYAAGAIILTLRFLLQLISLKRLINKPGALGAFSFFKSIRIGTNIENMDVITAHEQVHARQWHSADILLMEAISIINWFNPVVYFYRLGIKHIHEFIADRQALKGGTDKTEYALLLLSQTFKTPAHQLVNPFFNHSLLKRRIIMLQKNRSRYAALLKYGLSAPLFILMLILSSATISSNQNQLLFNNKPLFNGKSTNFFSKLPHLTERIIELSPTGRDKIPGKIRTDREVVMASPTDTAKNEGPVFTAVEKEPGFNGGMDAFFEFLRQNLKYPEAARKNNVQGKVIISFIVEKDGSLSDIKVLRDIGYGAGDEAIRVMKLSPKWNPGNQNGRLVRVMYTIPISFSLAGVNKDTTFKTGNVIPKKNIRGNVTNVEVKIDSPIVVLNSLKVGQAPLYLLDGKEIPDLSSINPNSIQSISVIKPRPDNSLVALYGIKAANGVVLISTKEASKPKKSN